MQTFYVVQKKIILINKNINSSTIFLYIDNLFILEFYSPINFFIIN